MCVWGGGGGERSEEKSWIRPPNCPCRGATSPPEGDGGIKVLEESGVLAIQEELGGSGGGKSEEKEDGGGTASRRQSQRADTRTKAQGGFMRNWRQNRRSRGERMTSEKYATAVVHYLR